MLVRGSPQAPNDGAGAFRQPDAPVVFTRHSNAARHRCSRKPTQVVSRLSALKAWDTDGRLERFAREKPAAAPQSPIKAMFSDSVRAAVRTSGSKATLAMSEGEVVRMVARLSLKSFADSVRCTLVGAGYRQCLV